MNAIIVSPVSRHLVVSNVAKSIDFYRDSLGFEVPEVKAGGSAFPEVVYGPARILFHSSEKPVESTGFLRPPGKTMVFFETDNVHAMYSDLKQRGANPTEPEKVNWMKMEFFEVCDPDGHRLWYGKSYHENFEDMHTPPGKGQLRQIMPEFPFSNVPVAVTYYQEVLGFSVNYQQHDLGVMDRDEVRLLLLERTENHTGIGSCYIYIQDADRLYEELLTKGANVLGEPISHPWGLREFQVLDLEGNRISFAETFE
jgi:uncharacterized glyoxalase superfamily protein PhnB